MNPSRVFVLRHWFSANLIVLTHHSHDPLPLSFPSPFRLQVVLKGASKKLSLLGVSHSFCKAFFHVACASQAARVKTWQLCTVRELASKASSQDPLYAGRVRLVSLINFSSQMWLTCSTHSEETSSTHLVAQIQTFKNHVREAAWLSTRGRI